MRGVRLVDETGREWRVYDYSIYAGKKRRSSVGDGAQYRGFVPVDGGARRTLMMRQTRGYSEAREPITRELLLAQLGRSAVYEYDNPEYCRRLGIQLERVDP